MVHKDNAHDDTKPPKVTTYVLIGHDQHADEINLRARGDVSFICPDGAISKDTFKNIILPANIQLGAHGSWEEKFVWRNATDLTEYKILFESLPNKGIYNVLIESCYGGTALNNGLKYAPAGAIVQTSISPNSIGYMQSRGEIEETRNLVAPIDIYLKTLDNFPKDYKKLTKYFNKKEHEKENINSNDALPSRIGIGGEKGGVIDFDETYATLAKNPSKIDSRAMDRAIERVQEHFDTKSSRWSKKEGWIDGEYGSSRDERALDKAIETAAANLQKGRTPRSFEERRIALALAAAYTEETGELAAKIREAGGVCPPTVKDPKYDARGNGIAAEESVTPSQTNPLLTKAEDRYIATVNEVLTARPKTGNPLEKMMNAAEIKEVITQITAAFSKTEGSDALGKPLADRLAKACIATRGWER